MQTITRRKLLATTAVGGAVLAFGAGSAAAMISKGHDAQACARNHHALGHKLSTLIADPAVAENVKNHAIKTASCPTCGTGIAPTGLGLAVSTWA